MVDSIVKICETISPILGIVLVILYFKLHSLEMKIDRLEQLNLSERFARIETDLQWIKERLDEHR